ncbi:NADH-quinone oxidoreductase subunit L [Shewanella vesiculosa]|uniref:NADH-quinone oxidoreductase subunit L n=1 Tax=Shewanella vesiculosa TaxID=518738 RepID=UPI003D03FA84
MNIALSSVFLLCIPITLLLASALSGRLSDRARFNNKSTWLIKLSGLIVVLYITALVVSIALPSLHADAQYISQSRLSLLMMGLVVFMSVILIAFSRNYMAGEPRSGTYWHWLLNILAAVSVVVISNHLLLFWLGWVSISLALHKLLTFYPERPRAALAAHKKFLLARTAETSLLAAIILLYQQHGSLLISDLLSHFNAVATNDNLQLTTVDHIAAVLIALTALIKCAQLPVHGWLIQVVEAPTPVSALLHAGVINLGGFLLILFAPLFIQSTVAQWLVLIVAGLTTVMAALIMTTRISIKVRLAWSTSAQMGLMLVECALGLFELALLHLLTHSVYKAYAFLNSSSAVYEDMQRRLAPAANPKMIDWIVAGVFSSIIVSMAVMVIDYQGVWSVWLLLVLALTMLLAQRHSERLRSSMMPVFLLSILLVISYSGFKWLFGAIIPATSAMHVEALSAVDIVAIMLFVSLFVLNWMLRYQPHRPSIHHLHIALFAGLYLDEWLTRLTLQVWPVQLPAPSNNKVLDKATEVEEV